MSAEHTPPGGLGQRLLAAAQQDTSWLVRIHGDAEHRLTTAEVVDAYNDQRIEADTYVWTEGMASWEQLQAVDALVDALHAEAARLQSETGSGSESRRGSPGSNGSTQSEDSLVFSLATLVQDHPAQGSSVRAADDSGLIDLAALSASSGVDRATPLPTEPPRDLLFGGGLFPEAKAEAPHPPTSSRPQAPSKQRGLIIGLSAAAALLAGLLLFQVVRTTGAPASPQPGMARASATPEPAAEARGTPSATPSAATVGSTDSPHGASKEGSVAVAETKTPAAGRRPPTGPRPTAVKPPVSPPPATSARRITGACPCEEHDLMCQMRCAAKP